MMNVAPVTGTAAGMLDMELAGGQRIVAEITAHGARRTAHGGKAPAFEASVRERAQVDAAVTKLDQAFGTVTFITSGSQTYGALR